MKRRDFMNWVGIGAIATSLPIAIAACGTEEDTADTAADTESTAADAGSDAGSDAGATSGDFVEIGTLSELSEQGYLASADALETPVIVIEDPAAAGTLIALTSVCTHTGCTVEWQEDLLACPCHGSKFNPDGSVVDGPASEPLAQYEVKQEGDAVLVAAV